VADTEALYPSRCIPRGRHGGLVSVESGCPDADTEALYPLNSCDPSSAEDLYLRVAPSGETDTEAWYPSSTSRQHGGVVSVSREYASTEALYPLSLSE
jgi:hypothetical protein